jgi:single-strand DNA-binding protein
MFETHICVVGNVLTAPEWRRTSASGRLVTSFKVAAGTRRLDRTTGNWVDGNGLRVRVSCWRDLAGGVASSIMVGDPVIVYGQIYTRDWVDKDGTRRTLYEMEAQAVGHNLARGRARFARNKPVSASEVEPDPTEPVRLGGEATEPAFGLPTGLKTNDPLRQLDDSTFDEPLTLDEPLSGLADWGDLDLPRLSGNGISNGNGNGLSAEGAGNGFGNAIGIGQGSGLGVEGGIGNGMSAEGGNGMGNGFGIASRALDEQRPEDEDERADAPESGAEDDEDAVDEESADDAEAVEHRPEDESGDEPGETVPDTAKSRRRRRTPAGV